VSRALAYIELHWLDEGGWEEQHAEEATPLLDWVALVVRVLCYK
jgi:hypothetical protein